MNSSQIYSRLGLKLEFLIIDIDNNLLEIIRRCSISQLWLQLFCKDVGVADAFERTDQLVSATVGVLASRSYRTDDSQKVRCHSEGLK